MIEDELLKMMGDELLDICLDTINSNRNCSLNILEDNLLDMIPFDANVTVNGCEIVLNVTLPTFTMGVNLITWDIIYCSDDESIDLAYTITEDMEYIFYSNDPVILSYLSEFGDDLTINEKPIKSRVLSLAEYLILRGKGDLEL